tara:strand:- start:10039 stop:10827 length:789 start_codon:yes stop_codon:yes gene_type:complete
MPEVTYNILDYNVTISEKSFQDVIKEIHSKKLDINDVQLSKEQLKTFLSILFVYGMHYDTVDKEKRTSLLKAIAEEKLPLFQIPKKFCLYLLNNLDAPAQVEFTELHGMRHNLSNPLSNERILDFVEMELMDVSESFRKWEYGRFVSKNISEYFFKNIQWDRIQKALVGEPKKAEKYLEVLEKQIDKSGDNLSAHEKLFLQLITQVKLYPEKVNMADYLAISTIFQKKIFNLSLNIDKLEKTLGNAVKESKFKGKDKGGQIL